MICHFRASSLIKIDEVMSEAGNVCDRSNDHQQRSTPSDTSGIDTFTPSDTTPHRPHGFMAILPAHGPGHKELCRDTSGNLLNWWLSWNKTPHMYFSHQEYDWIILCVYLSYHNPCKRLYLQHAVPKDAASECILALESQAADFNNRNIVLLVMHAIFDNRVMSSLFCPSSWATGLCEDLIKQNKGESRYTKSMILIKSATVTDRIQDSGD
ncbi:hypothetical protein J6590_009111 [Homalodisca vitripennis]|nr:hypothetical protein J6590_009111 [Homalodisca vitripennis]